MNPKAAENWNFARQKLQQAQLLIDQDMEEQAKTEIAKAVFIGAGAIYYIHGQSEQDALAHTSAQQFIQQMAEQEDLSAAEIISEAIKLLNYLASLAPEEDPLPQF